MQFGAPKRQIDLDMQLLRDVQSYIYEAGDGATFADLLRDFPGLPASKLVDTLTDLEAEGVVTLRIFHNARLPSR
jgi:DNA-binding HxlR family transcriptional regulator